MLLILPNKGQDCLDISLSSGNQHCKTQKDVCLDKIRCAHISDLHFASWDWDPSQFFSKRWLGNFNGLFRKSFQLSYDKLFALPQLFKEKKISTLFITGDLTSTSSVSEFEQAADLISQFEQEKIELFLVPGNHDCYTKEAERSALFYRYFPSQWGQDSVCDMRKDKITAKRLSSGWWLIGLDTTIPTPYFSSYGYFSESTEQLLRAICATFSTDEKAIILNHFPFWENFSQRKKLQRGDSLQKLIEETASIKIFCHGHTHKEQMVDLQKSRLPIIIDTGSSADRTNGRWSLIEISKEKVDVEVYSWFNNQWIMTKKESFFLI